MNTKHIRWMLLGATTGLLLGAARAGAEGTNGGCAPPPPDLLSLYRAESSADDAAANNHGTLVGDVTFAPGAAGQAFELDAGEHVDLGHLPQLSGAQALSVFAWVKKSSYRDYSAFVAKWHTLPFTNANTFLLGDVCGYSFHVNFADDTGALICTGSTLPIDEWLHLAATWQSSDGAIRLYLNGALVGSASAGMGQTLKYHEAYTAKLGEWGYYWIFNAYRFHGLIDEVGIVTRSLSAPEIETIYAVGSAGLCVVPPCCSGNADKVSPGSVTFNDILTSLANFGSGGGDGTGVGDSDCDGDTDFNDILASLATFGSPCP